MKYAEYKFLILSDLFRIVGNTKFIVLVRHIFVCNEYKYSFWMRTCRYTKCNPFLKFTIYPIARLILYRLSTRLGISIYPSTEIGNGFNINHIGGIVINGRSIIGKNCTVSHGVTLGQKNRGQYKGCPILGDDIYIGPGAKIIGSVKIGNNVAIGANSVVTKDIPDNSVVVGVPGKVISQDGAAGYVNNTEYEDELDSVLFNME